ncbi:small multi-drug export protein [Evansella tamaricis]|uniref:Small multi-drug export protein n=1 Tax=Evansella tamaricis TaxID=2069301 RepID=A0ABS6JPL6_9BACI|nr:small multi-drug export protein [Evansella tamaricis]MBU9714248.1 small multi-drug export protein [Evansella tamaricis]
MFETLWQYFLIFVMAATPWIEILLVIPIGIAFGLHPAMVGLVSFLGNFLPIFVIIYSFSWFRRTKWYQTRQIKNAQKQNSQEESYSSQKRTKKEKAAAIFQAYGLPGLAFLGPIITGIHLAAIIALSLKASKKLTTFWMGLSLLVWTIVITISAYYGIDWLTSILG